MTGTRTRGERRCRPNRSGRRSRCRPNSRPSRPRVVGVGGGRQRMDGPALRGGPGLAGVARVLLGAGAPLNARLRTDDVLLGPGAAEHAEPLRPGPVQPVPPDRRDPAAHRCAEGHAPPALGGVGRRRGRGRSAAFPRGKHPCAGGRRQQAVGCRGGQARLEGGARCCCRAAPVRGRRTTTAPPPSWIQVRGRCIDTRAADDEWSVAHRNRNSGR